MHGRIEQYNDIPDSIPASVNMNQANASIKIYNGAFVLKDEKLKIEVDGKIAFYWLPQPKVRFVGKVNTGTKELLKVFNENKELIVIVKGFEVGKALITNISNTNKAINDFSIKGILLHEAIFGNKLMSVEKICFSIPNFKEFFGDPIKEIHGNTRTMRMGRIELEDDDYIITLDRDKNYSERRESLMENGGYILLYSGMVMCKGKSIIHPDSKDIFQCLSTFLSFLNGRKISALFLKGIYENQVIWTDYTSYYTVPYSVVESWSPFNSINDIKELWRNFRSIWQNPDGKDFFISAIHWYIEANGQAGLTEGSIVLAQNALELLYNWWIVERIKSIPCNFAAGKIRLILKQLKTEFNVPSNLKKLRNFSETIGNVKDAPEAIVYIRNAIVHSRENKRRVLNQMPGKVKHEALQLALWYIELSLLRILDYRGKYKNRCSQTEENVPW